MFSAVRGIRYLKTTQRLSWNNNFVRLKSYHHTPGNIPLVSWTCGDVLNRAAALKPDHTAVVCVEQNIRKTYVQYKHDVDRLASGLLGLGLSKNATVAIWAPNMYEWVVLQYAVAKAGMIMVNVNPISEARDVEFVLNKARCEAVVFSQRMTSTTDSPFYDTLLDLIPELASNKPHLDLKAHRFPHLKKVICISEAEKRGSILFSDVQNILGAEDENRRKLEAIEPTVDCDMPVNVQFTSGTTGSPKGAIITHHNMVNNGLNTGIHFGMQNHQDIRICVNVPLFHTFGCTVSSVCSAVHLGTMVMPSMRYSPKRSLEAIEKEKCTYFYGTPTMYIDIASHQEKLGFDVSSLHTGAMGGAPAPAEVIKTAMKHLNIRDLHVIYGCTETGPVVSSTQPTVQTAEGKLERVPIEDWIHTVGKPLGHIEVKIINPDTGVTVPHGERGELCSRGYNICQGYLHDEERTKKDFDRAGWYHTGDEARMSSDGTLVISGRLKDIVIRGGENVYPVEIEDIIFQHHSVEEVQVCGVPDKRLGEEVCAWIKVKQNEMLEEEEIKAFCKGKLSAFKIPRYILFVDSFPKTASGKIQKYIMREESMKKLGISH